MKRRLSVRSEFNVHQLVDLIGDVATFLVHKVLHGLLGFDKFSSKGRMNLFSRAKFCINRVIARGSLQVVGQRGRRLAVDDLVGSELRAGML